MRLRCRFGWHQWGEWIQVGWYQRVKCSLCGIIHRRWCP
jgi:hypothetical protein